MLSEKCITCTLRFVEFSCEKVKQSTLQIIFTSAPVAAGSTCGICDQVSDPNDCAVDQTCQPNEVWKKQLKQDINFFSILCYVCSTQKCDDDAEVRQSY